ncbi:MAG: hypothetical protein GY822_18770 [Deltaproteobacteria bacterium]|nr:hypothetical protein [Deltaproteobacteria bacterium]
MNKDLYNLRNGGQICGNFPLTHFTDDEKARLYVNRPSPSWTSSFPLPKPLKRLWLQKKLMPDETQVLLFQGKDDVAIDAVSPILLQGGLSATFEPVWLDTWRHTFLRTEGKDDLDESDFLIQELAFELIFTQLDLPQ